VWTCPSRGRHLRDRRSGNRHHRACARRVRRVARHERGKWPAIVGGTAGKSPYANPAPHDAFWRSAPRHCIEDVIDGRTTVGDRSVGVGEDLNDRELSHNARPRDPACPQNSHRAAHSQRIGASSHGLLLFLIFVAIRARPRDASGGQGFRCSPDRVAAARPWLSRRISASMSLTRARSTGESDLSGSGFGIPPRFHPVAQSPVIDTQVARYFRDRLPSLDHRLHSLSLELLNGA
jgi:hypothetical protein